MHLFKVFFLALVSNKLHSTNVTLVLLFTNIMCSQHMFFQLVLFTVLFSTNVTELSFDLLMNCFLGSKCLLSSPLFDSVLRQKPFIASAMNFYKIFLFGLERFLCRGIYISHFPLTGWQYFTKKVLTHTVETSFKDCCKEIFLSSIVVYCKYISIEPLHPSKTIL